MLTKALNLIYTLWKFLERLETYATTRYSIPRMRPTFL